MITRRRWRGGFTMVELMVTVTIVAIMLAVVFGAMQQARTAARISKTKATVAKLNHFIMAKYDSYRTRRVTVDTLAYAKSKYSSGGVPKAKDIARARLNALRDLMRLEMPDRWSDVAVQSSTGSPSQAMPLVYLGTASPPALSLRYFMAYRDKWNTISIGDKYATFQEWGAAECLYLIVTAMPEAAGQFANDEFGDIDGDGLYEFHDGWGRPIRFLRWPAGFVHEPSTMPYQADSSLQTVARVTSGGPYVAPDPFDPAGVGGGYALYPLIYSAGPDGQFDINTGKNGTGAGAATMSYQLVGGNLDPYNKDPNGFFVGMPQNNDSTSSTNLRHFDNIHNHRIEAR